MSDEAGYPTDEELERISKWNILEAEDEGRPNDGSIRDWFAYIKSVGNYWPSEEPFGWYEEDTTDELLGKPVHRYHISTGGWSGNESIIEAMKENFICWYTTWRVHRWGGHFTFEIDI